jgi:hypothetical protein
MGAIAGNAFSCMNLLNGEQASRGISRNDLSATLNFSLLLPVDMRETNGWCGGKWEEKGSLSENKT